MCGGHGGRPTGAVHPTGGTLVGPHQSWGPDTHSLPPSRYSTEGSRPRLHSLATAKVTPPWGTTRGEHRVPLTLNVHNTVTLERETVPKRLHSEHLPRWPPRRGTGGNTGCIVHTRATSRPVSHHHTCSSLPKLGATSLTQGAKNDATFLPSEEHQRGGRVRLEQVFPVGRW